MTRRFPEAPSAENARGLIGQGSGQNTGLCPSMPIRRSKMPGTCVPGDLVDVGAVAVHAERVRGVDVTLAIPVTRG